ncbi:MAG: 2-oxoacid:acceptor oxidoreductase family protein [Burkholderiales bacterium]
MFRIRFHGRGGQGIKSASRVLGTAFFRKGYEVQDAPRYGAERRGAPIAAYVRAAQSPIHERGLVVAPDLVAVADATLFTVPAAGIHDGVTRDTVLLIASSEPAIASANPAIASADPAHAWHDRLKLGCPIVVLPTGIHEEDPALLGMACTGGAARLVGVLDRATLAAAVREEAAGFGPNAVERSLAVALAAFDALAPQQGIVSEGNTGSTADHPDPEWIDLRLDDARDTAPTIYAPKTSERSDTGAWRTMRPVIDYERCNRCSWICSTLCPDGAIKIDADHTPRIDYDHCKGCMICVTVCPPHAIRAVAERDGALLLRDIR